jgi:hypothetical protein
LGETTRYPFAQADFLTEEFCRKSTKSERMPHSQAVFAAPTYFVENRQNARSTGAIWEAALPQKTGLPLALAQSGLL